MKEHTGSGYFKTVILLAQLINSTSDWEKATAKACVK